MSDDNIQDESNQEERPIENLKSEFDRKFENLSKTMAEQLQAIAAQQAQTLQQMQSSQVQAQPASEPADFWDNPEQAVIKAVEKVVGVKEQQRVEAERAAAQQQTQVAQTMNELYSQFPELGQAGSDLYRQADKLLTSQPADRHRDPAAIRAAVYQAALDLGVAPAGKRRTQSSDDFVFGGSTQTRTTDEGGELPKDVDYWRKMLGVSGDKDTKKRIKDNLNRDWTRFKEVETRRKK